MTIWCSRLHQLQPLVCTILWRARYYHLWDKKGIDWSSTTMTVIWTCSLFGLIWMDSALLLPHLLNNIDVNTHNVARPILDFLVTFSGVVHWVWPITRSKATPITVNLLQSTVILSAINVTQTFRFKVSVAVLQLWYYILGPSKLLRIPYLLTVTKTSYQFKGWLVQFKISPSSNSGTQL